MERSFRHIKMFKTIDSIKVPLFRWVNGKEASCRYWRTTSGSIVTQKTNGFFLNARETFHRVTEVTGYRLSIIYHTPQHLHRLSSEDWDILRDTGFPVDAVWEQGMTNQDESDDESDLDHKINEVVQSVDTPKTLSRQTSAEEAQGPLMELDDSLDIPWSSLGPTMQATLWLSRPGGAVPIETGRDSRG